MTARSVVRAIQAVSRTNYPLEVFEHVEDAAQWCAQFFQPSPLCDFVVAVGATLMAAHDESRMYVR